jgi:hypothetical protein
MLHNAISERGHKQCTCVFDNAGADGIAGQSEDGCPPNLKPFGQDLEVSPTSICSQRSLEIMPLPDFCSISSEKIHGTLLYCLCHSDV